MELCIQLGIIMVGKKIMKTGLVKGQTVSHSYHQCVKDFTLVEWGPQGLFPEYLEVGIVDTTFFVSRLF
jgi:hypothetical protein